MDLAQLRKDLAELGVRPKDVNRAALYIDYLDQAKTYFTTTLAGTVPSGGLGDGYPFVAPALRSAKLLQQLAKMLDAFVAPAVEADLRRAYQSKSDGGLGHGGVDGWTYQDYFSNVVLNADADTFAKNIQAFRKMYRIPAAALQQLSANFQGNVFLACQRIIADRKPLTDFYRDLYERDFTILSLQRIKSTGSDFHKGGKQVLILTFEIVHTVDYDTPPILSAPSKEELKVVYKPSDLEVDCRIVGDSAAVNRVLVDFMTASLFEIYNRRLQTIKTTEPDFTGEPLTTYRILPRPLLPIRDAYGYIQYLDHDLSGTAQQIFGYYPFGASDYLIFQSQNKEEITRSFYRQEGALAALCGSFSLIDMHIENVRVKNYRPYLIDLEVSLTQKVDSILAASLLGDTGGITGINIAGKDFSWEIRNETTPGKADLARDSRTVYCHNRLWFAEAKRGKNIVGVSKDDLLQGFTDGMRVLRACQQNKEFQDWFGKLNHVIVRHLPYGTSEFNDIRSELFIDNRDLTAELLPAQTEALRYFLTKGYNAFQQAGDKAAEPNFVVLTQTICGPDYLHLDIPVFYHRIGTTGIVDSRGVDVPIPEDVTIDRSGSPPTRKARVTGVGGIFNRATFFATPPTQPNVEQGQVQILGGDGFDARLKLLTDSIVKALGDNDINPPHDIVDIDKKEVPF